MIHENMRQHELIKFLEDMSLYEKFEVDNQKFIVTHSWLINKDYEAADLRKIEKDELSVQFSVWDRWHSNNKVEGKEGMPIVIHGHTPTLGKQDVFEKGCRALARIKKEGSHNINVDCCAFYSPMRGGNLAAYRCEDGAEFPFEERIFDNYIKNRKCRW